MKGGEGRKVIRGGEGRKVIRGGEGRKVAKDVEGIDVGVRELICESDEGVRIHRV